MTSSKTRLLLILSVPALLAACTTTSAATPPAGDGACVAEKAGFAVGQPYTVEIGANIQDATGARTIRAIGPGQAVTMDYRPDRVNVEIGADGRITKVSCG